MSHDVTRLPKWAQGRIAQAEQSARYWREKMTFADSGDTEVFIRRFGVGNIGLPPESMVSFMVTNDDETTGRFDVRLGEDQRLEVIGVGAVGLSDQVRVIPRSTNLFYVELTPWENAQ